jgi:hypothetical protein
MADQFSTLNPNDIFGDEDNAAASSLYSAVGKNPDEYAANLNIANQSGLPLDVVERNKGAIEKKMATESLSPDMIFSEAPEAKKWLEDKHNSALVIDDPSMLGAIKRTIQDIPKSFVEKGLDRNELIDLRYKQLFSELTPEESARATAISDSIDTKQYGTGGGFSTALTETAGFLPQMGAQIGSSVKGAVLGGAAAAPIGLAGGPFAEISVPAAIAFGSRTGWKIGAVYENYRQNSALAYDQMQKIKDENGNSLDNDVTRGASIMVGLASAPLDAYALEKVASNIPGFDQLKGVLTRGAVKTALQNPGMRTAFAEIGRKFATGVSIEGVVGAVQQGFQILGEEYAKQNSNGNFARTTLREAGDRMAESAIMNAEIAGVIGGAGASIRVPIEAVRNRGTATPDQVFAHVDNVHKTMQQNVLYQRSPDRFYELAKNFEPESPYYVNGEQALNVINAMAPEKQTALFNAIPDLKTNLENAAITGGDVPIKRADYATFIAPQPEAEALKQFVKLDPEDMSVGERTLYQKFIQENPELAKTIREEVQRVPEQVPEESYAAIDRAVRQSMLDAGRSPIEARSVAPLFARTISRFAAPFGQNATDVFNGGLLKFQQIDSLDRTISEGSNYDVLIRDVNKLESGGKLDEASKSNAEAFKKRLENAGISPKHAAELGGTEVFSRLTKANQETTTTLSQTERVPMGNGLDAKVLVNPSPEEARALVKKNGSARSFADQNGNFYLWDALDLTHDNVQKFYGLKPNGSETYHADPSQAAIAARTFAENRLSQGERGSISMLPGANSGEYLRKSIISFTQHANFSTGVHEFSHWATATHRAFAELAKQKVLAGEQTPDVNRIFDDWQALKKFVDADSDEFTVAQEEKIASAFEVYMREGKTPSEALRGIFTRFRDWLTQIYKDLTGFNVEMSDEIRGVFDRWLASEQEIEKVQRKNSYLAEISQNLNLPENITDKIASYMNNATAVAEEKIFKEMTREQKRMETKAYKEEFAKVRTQVAEEFIAKREYNLANYLRESGKKVYIDPTINKSELGNLDYDFAPLENVNDISLADLERFNNDQMDFESQKKYAIDILLAKQPKEPKKLSTFLISKGGLKESSGELKTIGIDGKTKLLNNKSGLDFDRAREAAAEAGYISEDTTVADFLDAVREDFSNSPVYRQSDIDLVIAAEARQHAQEIADKFGIDLNLERLKRQDAGNFADILTAQRDAENVVHPDDIAALYGYESGTEMLRELRRTPNFDRAVNQETRNRLSEKYPDMIENGRISNKATSAIMNDKVLLALDLMIKEIGLAKGDQSRISMKYYARMMAQQQFQKIKASDANYAFRYDVAREKEMRQALIASRKGKPEEASIHLQKAMVAQVLYKSLQDFKDTREAAEKLFDKVNQSDKELSVRADMDFVGAARYVLYKFGLGGENFDLATWIQDVQERQPDVAADLVNLAGIIDAPQKPASELTIPEYLDVYNSIKSIYHTAKSMKEFQLGEKKLNTLTAVAEMVNQFKTHKSLPLNSNTQIVGINKFRQNLSSAKAALRRVELWTEAVDGEKNGPLKKYIWNPISKAEDNYINARDKWIQGYADILKENKDILESRDKIETDMYKADAVGRRTKLIFNDKMEMIGFLLHTGNQSNLEKLLGGYGINYEEYKISMKRLEDKGLVTKRDWELVQRLWNYVEDIKPLTQAAHKKLYGYRFDEIENQPVQTSFGDYKGGYWPAIADTDQTVSSKSVEETINSTRQYMLATTNKGFLKKRVENYAAPLKTDLRLGSQHLDKVLRFAYLEPTVRDVSRLINNQDFRANLKAIDPDAVEGMLIPFLQRAASQTMEPNVTGDRSSSLGRKIINFARSSAVSQLIRYNPVVALQNFANLSIAGHYVGYPELLKSFVSTTISPLDTYKDVTAASTMMANRFTINSLKISQEINQLTNRSGNFVKGKDFLVRNGMIFMHGVDSYLGSMVWKAAYDKSIAEGNSDTKSIEMADSVVRKSMGATGSKDVSKIEAAHPVLKMLMPFYSYFNAQANIMGTEFGNIMREQGWKGSPKMFMTYVSLLAVPAIIGDIIAGGLRGSLPSQQDDAEQSWLSYMLSSQLKYLAASVPVAGQAINAVVNSINGKPGADRISISPVITAAETTLRTVKNIKKVASGDDVDDSRLLQDVLTTVGFVTGVPLGQAAKPLSYIADVNEGDSRPQNVFDYGRGLIGGPAPKR